MLSRPKLIGIGFSVAVSLLSLGWKSAANSQESEKYAAGAEKLIEQKEYRKALDELIQEVVSDSENPKVYATLSLLYLQIKECSLAWKYFEVAKDLKQENPDLLQKLPALCEEPQEKKLDDRDLPSLMKVASDGKPQPASIADATILWLPILPEQTQWQSQAKLPVVRAASKSRYWELNLAQMRKVRELAGFTLPWVIIGSGHPVVTVFMTRDGWLMLPTQFPSPTPLTQP